MDTKNRKIVRICKRNTYYIHIKQTHKPKKISGTLSEQFSVLFGILFVFLLDFTRIQKAASLQQKMEKKRSYKFELEIKYRGKRGGYKYSD